MQLVRKISARTVFGSKTNVLELVLTDKTKDHPLFVVGGIVSGTKSGEAKIEGEDSKRPWVALTGRFKAINTRGEVFQSAVLFLPAYLVESVTAALAIEGDDKGVVQIKYGVFAKFDESSATSYVYGASNLLPVDADDPVEQLVGGDDLAAIGRSSQAQIAAPKEEQQAATHAETSKGDKQTKKG